MEASECFLYFLPERNSGSLRFVFSLLPFREVRRSADGGGDLFLAPGDGQRLSSPEAILADSLAIFGETADIGD